MNKDSNSTNQPQGFGRKFWSLLIVLTVVGVVYLSLVIGDSISRNQGENFSKAVKLPYILTVVETNVDYKFSTANITIKTVNNVGLDRINLILIYPQGRIDTISLENKSTFEFPTDFKDITLPVAEGDYEVILYNVSNVSNITSTKFSVVNTDMLNSIYKSFFGQNILPTIAAISIPLAWIYQNVVKLYLDRKKENEEKLLEEEKEKEEAKEKRILRIDKKLGWLHQNMKYYADLITSTYRVCYKVAQIYGKDLESLTKVEFDMNLVCDTGSKDSQSKIDHQLGLLLERIIQFLYDYNAFKKITGYYYFDNIYAENYVNRLMGVLRDQTFNLFSESAKFKKFVYRYSKRIEDPSYIDDTLDTDFDEFRKELHQSLCKEKEHKCSTIQPVCCSNHIECYYKNFLTMFYLLDICINKVALVSYSNEAAAIDAQSKVEKYKNQTRAHIINTMSSVLHDPKVDSEKRWEEIFEYEI